jgi:hypothetical protein
MSIDNILHKKSIYEVSGIILSEKDSLFIERLKIKFSEGKINQQDFELSTNALYSKYTKNEKDDYLKNKQKDGKKDEDTILKEIMKKMETPRFEEKEKKMKLKKENHERRPFSFEEKKFVLKENLFLEKFKINKESNQEVIEPNIEKVKKESVQEGLEIIKINLEANENNQNKTNSKLEESVELKETSIQDITEKDQKPTQSGEQENGNTMVKESKENDETLENEKENDQKVTEEKKMLTLWSMKKKIFK